MTLQPANLRNRMKAFSLISSGNFSCCAEQQEMKKGERSPLEKPEFLVKKNCAKRHYSQSTRLIMGSRNFLSLLLPFISIIGLLAPINSVQTNGSGLSCGQTRCDDSRHEACFSRTNETSGRISVQCNSDQIYYAVCHHLNCPVGLECRIARRPGSSDEIKCVPPDHLTDRSPDKLSNEEDKPKKNENQLAWDVVACVFCFIPLMLLVTFLVYHYQYKVPRRAKEKEELKRLFLSLGYDENSLLYKKVHDFIYA